MEIEKRITNAQQSIKRIAEIVQDLKFVARIKFSNKLKVSTSEVGYYSYTNRWKWYADGLAVFSEKSWHIDKKFCF